MCMLLLPVFEIFAARIKSENDWWWKILQVDKTNLFLYNISFIPIVYKTPFPSTEKKNLSARTYIIQKHFL